MRCAEWAAGIPLFYYQQLTSNLEAIRNPDHPDHALACDNLSFLYAGHGP